MEIFDLEKLGRPEQVEIFNNYMDYVEAFRKKNYSNIHPTQFEDYIYNDYFKCNNCNEWKQLDDKGTSELALTDEICSECMQQGYGS